MSDIASIRENFEDFSDELIDHRLERNKLHSVKEILFLTLCALICGSEGWRDIDAYGKLKLDFLRQFFPYKYGIPSDDTIRRFFRCLNPQYFQSCFVTWVKSLSLNENKHVAIDGKVSRHSFDLDTRPLHLVSAFASDCRLVLAQEKVDDKSNEITAIPKLLELIELEGSIVTIDAMGCQKQITQVIRDKKADYILALKGNQGKLHRDVQLAFKDDELLQGLEVDTNKTVDNGHHGRIETRICQVIEIPKELKENHDWQDLQTLIEIKSIREIKSKVTEEKRYYISSLHKNALAISKAVRSHWAIENSLHWVLDVTFGDDNSRIRKANASQNIAIIKHTALNLLQKARTCPRTFI